MCFSFQKMQTILRGEWENVNDVWRATFCFCRHLQTSNSEPDIRSSDWWRQQLWYLKPVRSVRNHFMDNWLFCFCSATQQKDLIDFETDFTEVRNWQVTIHCKLPPSLISNFAVRGTTPFFLGLCACLCVRSVWCVVYVVYRVMMHLKKNDRWIATGTAATRLLRRPRQTRSVTLIHQTLYTLVCSNNGLRTWWKMRCEVERRQVLSSRSKLRNGSEKRTLM